MYSWHQHTKLIIDPIVTLILYDKRLASLLQSKIMNAPLTYIILSIILYRIISNIINLISKSLIGVDET